MKVSAVRIGGGVSALCAGTLRLAGASATATGVQPCARSRRIWNEAPAAGCSLSFWLRAWQHAIPAFIVAGSQLRIMRAQQACGCAGARQANAGAAAQSTATINSNTAPALLIRIVYARCI